MTKTDRLINRIKEVENFENVKKIRQYVAGGGQETHYRVTCFID